jgi:hypothetical protein
MPARIDAKTWMQIRTAYVVKGWSAQKCGEEFGVNETTVKVRASKEGWTEERNRNTTDAQQAVAEDFKSAIADALQNHAALADEIVEAVRAGLNELLSDTSISPRNKAETLKVYAEAADKGIRLGRDVRGITSGKPSVVTEQSDDNGKVYEVVVEPEAQKIA